jgi:hypothetical protein
MALRPNVDVEAEADRLLSLDDSGRERELVVVALRLGKQAEDNWRLLRGMDEEFLHDITSVREGNVGPSEGTQPDDEHVDA